MLIVKIVALQSIVQGVRWTYFQQERRAEDIIYLIPLIATASTAVVTDYERWIIPNRLIAIGLIQGFLVSAGLNGLRAGLLVSLKGCVIPVVALYVLFLCRALGAGDIKLLAVVGTFVGTDVTKVIVYSFLAGGIISLVFLLKEILLSITNRKEISKKGFYAELRKSRVHFSAAILLGIMCYILEIV